MDILAESYFPAFSGHNVFYHHLCDDSLSRISCVHRPLYLVRVPVLYSVKFWSRFKKIYEGSDPSNIKRNNQQQEKHTCFDPTYDYDGVSKLLFRVRQLLVVEGARATSSA